MNTTNMSQKEDIHLQENGAAVMLEDKALPAEQILAEQNDQDNCPTLFIP